MIADAAPAAASPGTFSQTLSAFLDAHDAATELPGALVPAVGRQTLADDGKDAPTADRDDASDANSDSDTTEPPPIWLPSALLPLVPPQLLPATLSASAPVTAVATSVPSAPGAAAPPALATSPHVVPAFPDTVADIPNAAAPTADPVATTAMPPSPIPAAAMPSPSPVIAPALSANPTVTPAAVAAVAPQAAAIVADAIGRVLQTPARVDAPVHAAPPNDTSGAAVATAAMVTATAATAQPIAVSATPQPASQVFAGAIAAAAAWREPAARSSKQDPTDASAQLGIAAPLQVADRAVVQATGDAGGTALDLTQDTGLHRMIDHIETLRDAAGDRADAQDTRIRLVPDALGSVDVQVRQDGATVHVAFTAQHDATATLIADAQPRLTQLAAERGVTIGGTSVATDTGSSAQQQACPAPVLPTAPASALSEIETETPSDARVA
jgi:hypothetical protein